MSRRGAPALFWLGVLAIIAILIATGVAITPKAAFQPPPQFHGPQCRGTDAANPWGCQR